MRDRKNKVGERPVTFRIATKGGGAGVGGAGKGGHLSRAKIAVSGSRRRVAAGLMAQVQRRAKRRAGAADIVGAPGPRGRVTVSRRPLTAEQRRRSGGWGAAPRRRRPGAEWVTVCGLSAPRFSKETAQALAALIRGAAHWRVGVDRGAAQGDSAGGAWLTGGER